MWDNKMYIKYSKALNMLLNEMQYYKILNYNVCIYILPIYS